MKNYFFPIVFLFALSFSAPKIAGAASECDGKFITCPDGTQHFVMICADGDEEEWHELLCGAAE